MRPPPEKATPLRTLTPLERLGEILCSAREKKGFPQRTLARKARISHQTLIDLEKGRARPLLKTLYRLFKSLGDGLDPVSVYECWNTEILELPFYDREKKIYRITLAPGNSLEEILETPVAAFLQGRLKEKQWDPPDLAKRASLPIWVLTPLLRGKSIFAALDTIQKLAGAIEEDLSIFYLRFHQEIPLFIAVEEAPSGKRLLDPPEGRFNAGKLMTRQISRNASRREAQYRSLLHGRSKTKRQATRRYIRWDNAKEAAYLEVPEEWPIDRIRELDLMGRLRRPLKKGKFQDYLRANGIFFTTLYNAVRNGTVPNPGQIAAIARTAELPEAVVLLWFWHDLEKRVEIRACPRS